MDLDLEGDMMWIRWQSLEANIDVTMIKMDGSVRKVTIASTETTNEGLPFEMSYTIENV